MRTESNHNIAEAPEERQGKSLDANLDADSWHDSIVGDVEIEELARRVAMGTTPPWLAPILEATSVFSKVLELGSGTGELSAALAKCGRRVSLVDFSMKSLRSAARLFALLDLDGDAHQADVLKRLPFADDSFDCAWSSGLLEHFDDDQIAAIVRESARVSRGSVISLVPNAKSLPYRLGKWIQEREGRWNWGREDPKHSLVTVFEDAGLVRIKEWSVASEHAVNFLDAPELAPVAALIRDFYASLAPRDLEDLDAGYLLVTAGEVP